MRQTILEKTNLKRLAKGHAPAQRIGKSIGGYHVFPRQMAKTIPGPPWKNAEIGARGQQLDGGAKRKCEQQASASYGHYSYENPLQRCVSLHARTRST